MTVIDASVLVNLLLRPNHRVGIDHFLDDEILAPSILTAEVTNAVKKHVSLRIITSAVGREKITLLSMLPIDLIDTQRLSLHIWELARTLSTYDACYVSLAMHLDDRLMTSDLRLAREARRHVPVHFVDPNDFG